MRPLVFAARGRWDQRVRGLCSCDDPPPPPPPISVDVIGPGHQLRTNQVIGRLKKTRRRAAGCFAIARDPVTVQFEIEILPDGSGVAHDIDASGDTRGPAVECIDALVRRTAFPPYVDEALTPFLRARVTWQF